VTESPRSDDRMPPHGSMAEEAAKLVDVAQLWLASQSLRSAGRPDDVWAAATADDHVPTECRGCPICRVRRALADVHPEVYGHLAAAVDSIGAAIRAMDTRGTAPRRPDARP
jgi:hypothetical protein